MRIVKWVEFHEWDGREVGIVQAKEFPGVNYD